MKKIVLLLSAILLVFTSCEKEPVFNTIEPPAVDTSSIIVSHFIRLTTNGSNQLEPRKRRGHTVVYLHNTMSDSDKQVVYDLTDEITSLVGEDNLSFSFTDSMGNFDIALVYGDAQYLNDLFGTNANTNTGWWGATIRTYKECTIFDKSYIWYDRHNSKLIKHEFLHAMGLGHVTSGNSIMYHNLNYADNNMSNEDVGALKLLYYNGVYGEMVPPVSNPDSCTQDDVYLLGDEMEELKEFSQMIIDNNYQ